MDESRGTARRTAPTAASGGGATVRAALATAAAAMALCPPTAVAAASASPPACPAYPNVFVCTGSRDAPCAQAPGTPTVSPGRCLLQVSALHVGGGLREMSGGRGRCTHGGRDACGKLVKVSGQGEITQRAWGCCSFEMGYCGRSMLLACIGKCVSNGWDWRY